MGPWTAHLSGGLKQLHWDAGVAFFLQNAWISNWLQHSSYKNLISGQYACDFVAESALFD